MTSGSKESHLDTLGSEHKTAGFRRQLSEAEPSNMYEEEESEEEDSPANEINLEKEIEDLNDSHTIEYDEELQQTFASLS